MNLIYTALGWVLKEIYTLLGYISPFFQNYALAILLFTVLINVIFLPINFNQQKTMAKQTALRPKLDLLKKKCNGDNQKYNLEMQALYQRENVKMMGGCLPMLIRLPFLWGVWRAISNPLSYIINVDNSVIEQAKQYLIDHIGAFTGRQLATVTELDVLHHMDSLQTAMPDFYAKAANYVNFDLFGIDLTQTPKFTLNFSSLEPGQLVLWLIPILSGVTAFAVSWISMKINPAAMEGPGAGTMKVMMFVSPLMSLYIAFQVPAGVGMYWILSNLFMMAQTLILNKFYNPREMAEKAKREAEERREKERLERIEAKKKARSGDAQAQARAKSQKEINRQKLAAARKADAEKYGDVYTDVTDDDLE